MSVVISLCHFCEVDGPSILLCTQVSCDRAWHWRQMAVMNKTICIARLRAIRVQRHVFSFTNSVPTEHGLRLTVEVCFVGDSVDQVGLKLTSKQKKYLSPNDHVINALESFVYVEKRFSSAHSTTCLLTSLLIKKGHSRSMILLHGVLGIVLGFM